MAHHLGLRKCLSQTPKEETFRSSTIISFLSSTLALPPPPGSSAHGSAAHEESTCATKFRPSRRFGSNANETRTWVLFNWKRRREERQWLVIVCSQCGLGGCWLQVVPWVDGHTCAAGRQSQHHLPTRPTGRDTHVTHVFAFNRAGTKSYNTCFITRAAWQKLKQCSSQTIGAL